MPAQLPAFWIFMYRASPATYLVGAMASAAIGNTDVTCSQYELLKFDTPASTTCGQFLAQYLNYTHHAGSLLNPDTTGQCLYCPVRETNAILETMGIYVADRWRKFGMQFGYILLNILLAFLLYRLVRMPWRRRH